MLHKNTATKTTDERKHSIDAVILSHPDYHRRLQNHTGSADLCFISLRTTTNRALAGFIKLSFDHFMLPPVGTFTLP
ncbi:hypothetical protein Xmir_01706 [Xenorhabdus miraniensis]|uniref:Uncharacterized protein n=1 Tax=Xenorhabdus miraniensis TaxID=351674 RepID=A0A2D0JQN6_9GAMM|nr:hypothetical protein Xmir_02081 [Xenorhabdus miraniensis]PHM48932.1 hypothetical protein Xmir_01706 [Xenorhabdus miraniensis]